MNRPLEGQKGTSKFERAYLREKQARKHTEALLETKTREAFVVREKLEGQFDYIERLIGSLLDILIVTDSEGAIKRINKSCEEMTAYSESDLLEKNITELFSKEVSSPAKAFDNSMLDLIVSGMFDRMFETVLESKDWKKVPVTVSYSSIMHDEEGGESARYIFVVHDITKRKENEEEIKKAKERLEGQFDYIERLIGSLLDILIVTDSEGAIKRINKSCEEMTGYSEDDLLRKNITELFSKKVSSPGKPLDNSMLDLIVSGMFDRTFETVLESKNQKKVPATVSYSSIMHDEEGDESARYVFIVHDITKRKEGEEEIKKAHEELQKSQAMMVQSEKMAGLGQMAAGMAHEINNPIGFITSNVNSLSEYVKTFKELIEQYDHLEEELRGERNLKNLKSIRSKIESIKKENDFEFIKDDLETVVEETIEGTKRVKDIVQSLKSFVRLDEGEVKEANVNELLESTLKIANNEIKYKCEVEKNYGEIPNITCYPSQLNQVFMNFIVNGAQAIEEKGTITLETKLDSEKVLVKISDTGKGIKPEDMDKLFTPFFTTKDVGEGTGLGLSISHGIIEKHKGKIEVDSEVGRGTTFTVILPLNCEFGT